MIHSAQRNCMNLALQFAMKYTKRSQMYQKEDYSIGSEQLKEKSVYKCHKKIKIKTNQFTQNFRDLFK